MATCCERLSCSNLSTSSNEDDGSVFIEKNGSRQYFSPGELVQPCSSIESLMGIGGIFGTMNTVQAIWLDSKKPIESCNVSEALWILSRQIPQLQLCLSRRGMRLWFKRIKNLVIDFQSTSEDVMEVYQQMIETPYNIYSGPLWKVRLVMSKEKDEKTESYSAVIIFSVQHSITDGTNNMRLCREIVTILNKFHKGETVEPKKVVLSPSIDNSSQMAPRVSFLTKYFCKKFLATMIKNYYHKTSFKGSIPVPSAINSGTKVLFDDFSKSETKNLIKMCKASKITVHSFITTVTNFALLTVAQARSESVVGKSSISVTHCVNMRRYFDDQNHSDATGCHISFLEDKTKMSLSDAKDFWGTAKKIHDSMKDKLDVQKQPLTLVPILQLASMMFPMNVYRNSKGMKNKTDCHYVTTNMGNLKDLLPAPTEGDDIEISYMLRSVSSQLAGNPFLLTFHTFRERFMLSIDYYTNKMTDDVANEFFGVLCQYIRNMTNFNALEGLKKF